MRHLNKGRKLKRTSTHKLALLRNLASSLFEHKKLKTTEAKAKELRGFAEKLITKAKDALANEQQGKLPEGQTIDIHNRRVVAKDIRRKAVLQELFDSIAPVVASRNGGYTRITKLGIRRGDAGEVAMIELVDWSNKVDGVGASKKKKSTVTTKKKSAPKVKAPKEEPKVEPKVEEVVAPIIAEEVAPVEETIVEVAAEVSNTPESEAPAAEEVIAEAQTETVAEVATESVAEAAEETTNEASEEAKPEGEEESKA
jgi:large subunit ribosomal protein L17